MARCGCTSTTCSCKVEGGTGVVVTGKGAVGNPYRVNIDAGKLTVDDTATVDLVLHGSGTSADWYHLSANATVSLDELTDVTASNPASGQVLAWNNTTKQWTPAPPAVAAPGAINIGVGLLGDGSAPTPLSAKVNASAGLQVDGNGIALQAGVLAAVNSIGPGWRSYTPLLKNVDTYATAASTGAYGRYNVINKLCTAVGWLTSTNALDNVGATLPVPAVGRLLNIGTLGVYGTGPPADQSGIARILSTAHPDCLVVHAFSSGFRGAAKGNQLTWHVSYEVA
jgi:hypothetical protein